MALHGQAKTARELHEAGIAAFRNNDGSAAREALQKSLELEPDRPAALYNLGLVEFHAGNEGLGIGLWRKALTVSPDFRPARDALTWSAAKIPRSINRDPGFWHAFRKAVVARIGMIDVLALALLFTFLSGFLLLRHFGRRRRARLDERPLPSFPAAAALFVALLSLSLSLTAIKAYDLTVVRGTVLADRTPARTTPDPQATPLFDLFEGAEVIVRQSRGDWRQISVPGGLTGWVPSSALFLSSSRRAER